MPEQVLPVLTDAEKAKFLLYIKNVDLQELLIPDEEATKGTKRKYFTFGAYDSLRILSEKVIGSR